MSWAFDLNQCRIYIGPSTWPTRMTTISPPRNSLQLLMMVYLLEIMGVSSTDGGVQADRILKSPVVYRDFVEPT